MSKHKVCDILHPDYQLMQEVWELWRLTFKGGHWFINKYLKRLSRREEPSDFKERKEMTYCPAFAKSAVVEIKNSIFQRLVDVTRQGGPDTYQKSVLGELNGVDLKGSTMMNFMGRHVLPELLSMARVGVYIDAPAEIGETLADKGSRHPYVYTYWAEDIRSWCVDGTSDSREFSSILLRDHPHALDPDTGLPLPTKAVKFRHYWIGEDGFVHLQMFDENGAPVEQEVTLKIRKIPFVMLNIDHSLLTDVAGYQVAMLNMASADVNYAVKSNVPIYTEQSDPRHSSPHLRKQPMGVRPQRDVIDHTSEHVTGTDIGHATTGATATVGKEIRVGAGQGRQYGPNMDRPGFISPPAEPLQVSMEKQGQMKAEIRQLVHLAVTNLDVKMASAESKGFDERGLEAGLSAIGLELEVAERKIGEFWALYEGGKIPTIRYPKDYSLKTEQDRFDEAKRLEEERDAVPSQTFSRIISKRMAKVLVGHHATNEELRKIFQEIDSSAGLTSDPDIIAQDVERGLVSPEAASLLRGYKPGEADRAADAHAKRLATIAAHQVAGAAAARGIEDAGGSGEGSEEKEKSRQTETDATVTDKTRGEGK